MRGMEVSQVKLKNNFNKKMIPGLLQPDLQIITNGKSASSSCFQVCVFKQVCSMMWSMIKRILEYQQLAVQEKSLRTILTSQRAEDNRGPASGNRITAKNLGNNHGLLGTCQETGAALGRMQYPHGLFCTTHIEGNFVFSACVCLAGGNWELK